jgi:hypothetical protein
MPFSTFQVPPLTGNDEVDRYNLEVHQALFGTQSGEVGTLNNDNITGALTDTVDHNEFTEVEEYQHHGVGNHNVLDQGNDVTDASASTLSITSPDADATYSANEQTLINELKADFNSHITEYNTFLGKLNELLANLRTAFLID